MSTDIQVTIRLSPTHSSGGGTRMRLAIEDTASSATFFEAYLDADATLGLISNTSTGVIPAQVRGLDVVGLVREHVTQHHPLRDDKYDAGIPEWVRSLPAPEGGFTLERAHRNNQRQWVVTFARYVQADEAVAS